MEDKRVTAEQILEEIGIDVERLALLDTVVTEQQTLKRRKTQAAKVDLGGLVSITGEILDIGEIDSCTQGPYSGSLVTGVQKLIGIRYFLISGRHILYGELVVFGQFAA